MAQTWATSAPQCGLGHQQRCSALHTELAETEVGQSLAWCLEYLRQTAKRDSRSHPYFTVVQPATSSLARSKISGFSEPEKKKKRRTPQGLSGPGASRAVQTPSSLFRSLGNLRQLLPVGGEGGLERPLKPLSFKIQVNLEIWRPKRFF